MICELFEAVVGPNRSTVHVTWDEPRYKPEAEAHLITIRQEGNSTVAKGSAFPIGTTLIPYEAVDTYGDLKARCSVTIKVDGKSAYTKFESSF